MSNYNTLKATINADIKQNGNQEITGSVLNSVLNQMVNILGTGYQFAGIATPATNPGTPDAKVFYIANGKGTYTNFGGLEVTEDEVVILYWDTEWHKVSTGIASQEKLNELESNVNDIPELASTIIDGTINSSGVIEIQSLNRNLYVYPVLANQEIVVSNGDVYGWFSSLPEVGSVAISGRFVEDLQNTILSVPADATYIAVRAEDIPSIYYNVNGVRQEIEKVKTELASIQIKPIGIEGHPKLLIRDTTFPLVSVDEVYGGEIELKNADNSKSKFYSENKYYSICGLPKGTIINKVSLLAPVSYVDSYLLIARFNGTTFEILAKLKLKSGNGETYLDNIFEYECKEDVIIFANTFYFEPLTTTDNVPYIYNIDTGLDTKGRVDLAISIKISIAGIVGRLESIDNKILHIDNSLQIQSTIVDGTINPSGAIEIQSLNRNLYVYPVLANQEIVVSNGDVYGWFSSLPEVGSVAISGRFVEDLHDTILSVPRDATYIAIRAEEMPLVKIKMSQPSLLERFENLEQADVLRIASDLSMVETMGCCGDSYTAGMIAVEPPYYPTSETFERPNLSWGKILERHYGINVSIYAKGGMKVKDYLTDPVCLPLLLSDTAKKLYAISLGHNDAVWSTPVGSIASLVGSWEDYPDDFIGNYARIIEQIKVHAPNAYIILLRQSRPYALVNNGPQLNQAISDLGEHYGLPVFDPEDDPYLSSDVWVNTMIRRHPVFPGYAGMAMAFARAFAKATVTHWDYFRLFGIN